MARTVLYEIQPDAADDGHFVRRHGTEQFLHRRHLVGDFRRGVENIPIRDVDDMRLEAGFLGCLADVKVGGGEDGLAAEDLAVCGFEPDEPLPGWHRGRVAIVGDFEASLECKAKGLCGHGVCMAMSASPCGGGAGWEWGIRVGWRGRVVIGWGERASARACGDGFKCCV